MHLYSPTVSYADSSTSQLVTWTCTGSPCDWGPTLSGQALVWPPSLGPQTNRLGYTTSAGIYLPDTTATGVTITILSGSATVYAGLPNDPSHRVLATLGTGQSYQVTGLATGEVVSVQDGNSFTYSWVTPPPDTTITANPPSSSNSSSASFSFTGSDSITPPESLTFECKLDGGSFASCTSPANYNGLSAGSHTFEVRAINGSGNPDASPASYTWTVDTAAPDTTITANPTTPTNNTSASFSFTSDEVGSTFECKLDSGAFTACTSSQTYNSLGNGDHTFQVRATDAAGNIDATPATHTWKV
ncbi:MAG TPA: hypothetical protein PKE45_20850, partial [Caldilineaceae bacterium]|nr:hypothetical protein [Caldilineaceae bacterium]